MAELREFTGAPARSFKALVEAGFVETESVQVFRRPERAAEAREPLPELTEGQKRAFNGILAMADGKRPGPRCSSA